MNAQSPLWEVYGPAYTDAEGYYLIPDVPPDTYLVEAHTNDYMYSGEAYSVVVAAGASVQADIDLEEIMADAPYIYLYPEQAMQVAVTIDPSAGELIASAPEYGDGWSVWAEPDGLLDGSYRFLFYEHTVPWVFQDDTGWAVPATGIFAWFEEALSEMGLTADEISDFLDYWTVHLPYAPCYRVCPQPETLVDDVIGLDIEPAPDSLLRLWLLVQGADDCDEPVAPDFSSFERTGFTAVEWGVVLEGFAG